MIARIEGAERFAVHRTYLRPDGSGKAGAAHAAREKQVPGRQCFFLASDENGAQK